MPSRSVAPRQDRAKQTYEKLLAAAQAILERDGYGGLTTNAIVEEAGLTPPAFYRYFSDKQALLVVLAERLMAAQNALAGPHLAQIDGTLENAVAVVAELLRADIAVTRAFPASLELMVLMRALPELGAVRIASHDGVAQTLIAAVHPLLPDLPKAALTVRARLAVELYYSTHEMLAETGFANQNAVIERAAVALAAIMLA